MRFVTKTRFDYLENLLRSIDNEKIKKDALHILESIKTDIDENYAEIKRPIRLYNKD